MLAINTRTCFLACREAVIAMRRGGGGARIVNASRGWRSPRSGGGMVADAASKAAVASITLCLAAEVAAEGIWVNAIAPSIIDTPANRAAMPARRSRRWPRPAELARAIRPGQPRQRPDLDALLRSTPRPEAAAAAVSPPSATRRP
ncbi:MAG: SDR family oxidoreductase [Kofleriaceae bacterium]|nr:SDR family oxidoreductase [Kofleriaceae bacterium]